MFLSIESRCSNPSPGALCPGPFARGPFARVALCPGRKLPKGPFAQEESCPGVICPPGHMHLMFGPVLLGDGLAAITQAWSPSSTYQQLLTVWWVPQDNLHTRTNVPRTSVPPDKCSPGQNCPDMCQPGHFVPGQVGLHQLFIPSIRILGSRNFLCDTPRYIHRYPHVRVLERAFAR